MRTFAALVVFLVSLLGLGLALKAEGSSRVNIVPVGGNLSAPVEMDTGAAYVAKGHHDHHRSDGGDERGEEEFADDSDEALKAVDPTLLDDVLRLRLAARVR